MRTVLKALFLLVLSFAIFGPCVYFAYELYVRPQQMLKEEKSQPPLPPPPDPSLPELDKAVALKQGGKLVEARAALEAFLDNFPNSTKLNYAKKALGDVNITIFFSAVASPEKEQYVVKPGDALAKIEKHLHSTSEMIMRMNNLEDPRKLRLGQVLMIEHPEFSVIVSRKEKTVTLFNQGKFFKQFTPHSWNAPAPKKNAPPINGKVTERAAWKNGERVAFGEKNYAGSAHWVSTTITGFNFFTQPGEGVDAGIAPPVGIGFSPEEAEELSTLLSRGVPVTVE